MLVMIAGLLTIGCSDMGDPVAPPGAGNGGGGIDFASQVLPIFQGNCTPCHTSVPFQANLNLTSYSSLMAGTSDNGPVIVAGDPANSLLIGRLEATAGSVMPPGGAIASSQIDLIRQWITEGALETVDGNGGSGGVSFSEEILPIFQAHCYPCHFPPDPEKNVDLSSYAAVIESNVIEPYLPDESDLVLFIEGAEEPRMPLNGPYLSSETTGVIRQWIEEGAANDG